MNTFNQWLEGKKKIKNDFPDEKENWMKELYGSVYNKAIDDLIADSPTLFSTMEAEIREKIGENEEEKHEWDCHPYKQDRRYYECSCGNDCVVKGRNQERSRIHTIIHSYFNPQE